MKLLIVDDQSAVVQGLLRCTNWGAMGFQTVETALNAIDAKASLLRQPADVMLCDVEMPVESGLDLLIWLREMGMKTRCIFLTAHAKFQYAREALRLGGFDYIMQPAPYEQVIRTVARAVEEIRAEKMALELQNRGAAFDEQKKEIMRTMLLSFLNGSAPESGLKLFEEMGLLPNSEEDCWLVLLQPLRWREGEQPWQLNLLGIAVNNVSEEIFEPLEMHSVTAAMPREGCLVLVLQSCGGKPVEKERILCHCNYLNSACEQYIHCSVALYPEGPEAFRNAPSVLKRLLERRSENVVLKSGVHLMRESVQESAENFRIPQIASWRRLLQEGCAAAMESEACQLLDRMAENDRLNSQTLREFYQDYMRMVFSLEEEQSDSFNRMFQDPQTLGLYLNGMKTVKDMKALIHYVACFWGKIAAQDSRSVTDVITAYIAEHLENELRREELAEAVHLNPDYMARLFKKEMGINLKDYIIQQKMQEAQSLLCTTNLPISLIAAKVGYSNFAHFSTTYKKIYHHTPQEERTSL